MCVCVCVCVRVCVITSEEGSCVEILGERERGEREREKERERERAVPVKIVPLISSISRLMALLWLCSGTNNVNVASG